MRLLLLLLGFIMNISICSAQTQGPIVTKEEFFSNLDYSLAGLAKVKEANGSKDYQAAAQALLDYMRSRTNVTYPEKFYGPGKCTFTYDISKADDIVEGVPHGMLVDWYPRYQFKGKPEWDASPFDDREWHWGLNRHDQWVILGLAYKDTRNEKYAKRFVEELIDWVTTRPVVSVEPWNSVSWRPIEAGIRMSETWPEIYQCFLKSPSFTPEANLLFLMSMVDHAHQLQNSKTGGNHLLMEMNGLLHVGVLLPEYGESAGWRKSALDILWEQMGCQVYPDGMQFELTTTYHMVCINNFIVPLKLRKSNNLPLPDGYESTIEKMYQAVMYLMKPSGYVPAFNDADAKVESISEGGSWADARPYLRECAEEYKRPDMLYAVTNGKEGVPPSDTSHAFPYAGFYVMRNGWDKDALYMAFDAGPFGASHQHEDKLGFDAYAYGETLLFDSGRFSYADPVFRPYVLSSFAHNTAVVDGKSQARANQKPEDRKWVANAPLGNPWVSAKDFDYAEGVYNDGYGPELDKSVTHRRRVLFIKHGYWVIVDNFEGEGKHSINTLFHLAPGKARVDESVRSCATENRGRPNILIVPSRPADMSVSVVAGRESPCQGWISMEYNKKVAAPVVDYSYEGEMPAEFAYLLYPSKPSQKISGSIGRLRVVCETGDNTRKASAYEVRLDNGETDYILLAFGMNGKKSFAGINTDAEIAVVRADKMGKIISSSTYGGSFLE